MFDIQSGLVNLIALQTRQVAQFTHSAYTQCTPEYAIWLAPSRVPSIAASSSQHKPVVKFEMSSKRKSLALRVTSINLVSLERGSTVEYVFPCFQLAKLDLGVT